MSRIGLQPITIPQDVKVSLDDATVLVSGPKGELRYTLPASVHAKLKDSTLHIIVDHPEERGARALWGTARSLVANMVAGVASGFHKKLEVSGIGFKAELKGQSLVLSVGYSHEVPFPIPKGITIVVEKNTITVSGINKELVGSVAAQIRAIKKPEPYKGKGIRYADEVVRRKAGKAAKAAGATK